MAQSQAELESVMTDLTVEAFKAFAEDISTMFDTPVSAERIDIATGTVKELKDNYKKLAAVCSVKAEGAVKGQFHVVFDREALFTLAGTFVMQPEQIVTKNRKSGAEAEANEVGDALGEVGGLMVGSWDRVFRKKMTGQNLFTQGGTFIGNPSPKSEEKIGLADDEELLILTFEMTIDPLPPFNCAVLYPKSILENLTKQPTADTEPTDEQAEQTPTDQAPAETADQAPTEEAATEEAPTEEAPTKEAPTKEAPTKEAPTKEAATKEAAPEEAPTKEAATEEAPTEQAAEEQAATEETAHQTAQEAQPDEASADQATADQAPAPQDVDTKQDTAQQPEADDNQDAAQPAGDHPVSDAIREMTKSPAFLPGQFAEAAAILKELTAKDTMRTNVVWASADETVEQLLAKMQQHDTAYLLIGQKGNLEGIASKSDVRGALSPYLQTMFAKWRSPMDAATLQIKAKWVMSRPVRTVRPDATLSAVMLAMSEHGGRCMPVVDELAKVLGIVTVFDIFTVLLTCAADAPISPRSVPPSSDKRPATSD
jgi:CBS domain-containing protein